AAVLQPISGELRFLAAQAHEAAGQLDLAIRLYEQCLTLSNAPPLAWQSLARAQLRVQLANPHPDQRDWIPFTEALNKAQRLAPNSMEMWLMEASFLVAQGDSDRALDLLQRAERDCTNERDLMLLAISYEQLGQSRAADRICERVPNADKFSWDVLALQVE